MKTFKRTKLPEHVILCGRKFVFLSALDRIGHSANDAGFGVIKIIIDNSKRKASRRLMRKGKETSMEYSNPTTYFYISSTVTPEQIKEISR